MSQYNELPTINRSALIVTLKKPFIDWVVYVSKEHDSEDHQMIPDDIPSKGFDSKNVYLLPDYDENEQYETFLRKNFKRIFENELMKSIPWCLTRGVLRN